MRTDPIQKKTPNYFWIAVLICVVCFVIFIFPNRVASENIKMVAVFEPDESVPLPYVLKMIQPAESLKWAVIQFVFYDYYFYGFPYFASSALTLIPLAFTGQITDISLVMLLLRQVISVLPMLLSVLLLIQIFTGFKSYKSIVLLLLLLSIPAVVRNNVWWHPDSLATLASMLAIYFLVKDDLQFGSGFYIAAAMCGLSAATKGIGFYFFLTIAVYLLLGLFWKKIPFWKIAVMGVGFLLCMAAAYVAANPFLVYRSVRNDYFGVMMERQSVELYSGYWVLYPKGLLVSLPDLTAYFGNILFLSLALFACIYGIVKNKNRLRNIIVLTWMIPMSVLVFWLTNFKFQYWIPVALPLFAVMMDYLPDTVSMPKKINWLSANNVLPALFSLAIGLQFIFFVGGSAQIYDRYLHRAEDKPAIQFYDLTVDALQPLSDQNIFVYHDVRMYVPQTPHWKTEAVFMPLNYDYIRSRDFDVVLVMQQRIYDYLNPSVEGINPEQFEKSRAFYQDAQSGNVAGYHLVFRNDFGLVFVRDDVYQEYFEAK